jgi:phosphoglycolate phosphatase
MPSQHPALIFDLDGTLTDSKPGILGCLGKVIEQWHLGDQGPLDRFVGPPIEEWVTELLPQGSAEEHLAMAKDYRACYNREGWSNNSVFPGVAEVLTELRLRGFPLYVCTSKLINLQNAGFPLYVCTSKQQHFAVRILEFFDLASFFRAIYGDKSEYTDHTKPLLLGRLFREQPIDPAHAWMIGDRIHDIEAARINGLRSIAAGWGYGSLDERAQADAIAPMPADLPHIVQQ